MGGRGGAVRAPALTGRRWAGPGAPDLGLPLRMSGVGAPLIGRVVVLHFFTAGCVNCAHAHAELRELARAHPAAVVIGVHSPKFPHEGTRAGLDAALVRADLDHPVLDDADHTTWSLYAVNAWPTIVVVDPRGYVAQTFVGEGHGAAMDALVGALLETAPGVQPLDAPREDQPRPAPRGAVEDGPGLSSPSAALALPDGRVVVADPGNHRLVVLDAAAVTLHGAQHPEPLAVVGGLVSPAGMTLLPPDVAARTGWDLVVADPGAHAVLGVRLADGAVTRIAGTGEALRPDAPKARRGGPALRAPLSSPLDVAWCAGVLVVAMSGVHQLWALDLTADPRHGRLAAVAGSGSEGLLDARGSAAMLAQPSALLAGPLAPDAGGTASDGVWFVDAESSSLRRATAPTVSATAPSGAWEVTTLVGTGVHAFGHADGDAAAALMQHPLGVATVADGALLVADTYNGAVRRVDVARGLVTTLVDGLAEPVALVLRDPGTGAPAGTGEQELLVVESAAHRLSAHVVTAPHEPSPGPVRLGVRLQVPAGQRLDDESGPPVRLRVTALPAALVTGSSPVRAQDPRTWAIEVTLAAGAGTLVVTATVLTCDAGAGEVGVGAACHVHERTWRVPVVVPEPGAVPAPAGSAGTRRVDVAWSLPGAQQTA